MRRSISIVAAISLITVPVSSFGAYLVELKNEMSFVTNQYREEGGLILFQYRSGLVGLQKTMVRSIRYSDLLQDLGELRPIVKDTHPEAIKARREPRIADGESSWLLPSLDKETTMEKKTRMESESLALSHALSRARENGDIGDATKIWDELFLLQRQLLSLRDGDKASNGGKTPSWWNSQDDKEPAVDECGMDLDCGPGSVCVDGFCV